MGYSETHLAATAAPHYLEGVKKFAILTSGGDAPGMNAAIRAATLLGIGKGCEVIGVENGYQGLIEGAFRSLSANDVTDIVREGGTILGSARCKQFHDPKVRDGARQKLAEAGIEGLLVLGGNGSLTGMEKLTDPAENSSGLRAIGLPGSIDNDLALTRLSIGVDTAINTIVEACDKINDTASAHGRTFIVEVMGRDCGYLAMTSAIACAANVVLFPEMNKTDEEVVDCVVRAVLAARAKNRRRRVLVIKAEGVHLSTDRLKSLVDQQLKQQLGDTVEIETRVTVLGHVVRGGRPSAMDRQLGSRLAHAAVGGLLMGETRKMAAWMPPHTLPPEFGGVSPVDPQCGLIDIRHVLAETKAMLEGQSDFVKWRRRVFQQIEDVMRL